MIRNYVMEGLDSTGCVNHVKRLLLQLPFVKAAMVKLNPPMAILNLTQPVDVDKLQAQLNKAGYYTIREAE